MLAFAARCSSRLIGASTSAAFSTISSSGGTFCGVGGSQLLARPMAVPLFDQERGRKRNLKAGLSRQQRLERRQKREAKEAARKQYTFMERIKIRRMRALLSPSQMPPGRFESEKEQHLPAVPLTDVYFRDAVQIQRRSVTDALEFHRRLLGPAIFNRPTAPLRLRIELNMTTERATKMITGSEEIVPVPHPFPHKQKRSVLAFALDPKKQEAAVEAGAEIAVGPDVVKKIIKGQFRVDDYDLFVAHTEMSSHLLPLRGILRSNFPTRLNGGLGDDIPAIIERFRYGVKLIIKPDPVYPIWGLADVIIGKLDMNHAEVEANIATVIGAICKHRSAALGPFVNRALLMTTEGGDDAYVPLDVDAWLPKATEQELEKLEKTKSKKKERKREQEAAAAMARENEIVDEDPFGLSPHVPRF